MFPDGTRATAVPRRMAVVTFNTPPARSERWLFPRRRASSNGWPTSVFAGNPNTKSARAAGTADDSPPGP